MHIDKIPAANSIPDDINVVIEIPANADPVKYELDKDTGSLMVDRFMPTAMHYPCNYGFIPNTLADDGDPVDVLVITPFPVIAGALIRVRVLGMLKMTDESGEDAKLLAVPVAKLCQEYAHINTMDDVSPMLLRTIQHFFENYKGLEEGKWVKVEGWEGLESARAEIENGIKNHQ